MTKDDMPREIWASSRPQDVGDRFTAQKCYDDQTSYTLTSHHTTEIAKRDELLKEMAVALELAKSTLPYNEGHLSDIALSFVESSLQKYMEFIDNVTGN